VNLPAAPKLRVIGVAAAAAFSLGLIGALLTELGPWYYGLDKPAWQPPDWLFGPAWTLIFSLEAVAGYLAWMAAPDRAYRQRLLAFFATNGFFNAAWSWLFFAQQRPDWAFYEVGFLWLSVLALILLVKPLSNLASALLAPYLAWVTFAAILNRTIVELNRPFV
jgi:tryptophan-rich sensory protein